MLLWNACKGVWKWEDDDLYGHYHFGKPACLGSTLQSVIEAVRASAKKAEYDLTTVKGRQEALKSLAYYTGIVDGLWGPSSKGALISFQSDFNLTADGIWGGITEVEIIKALKG